MVKSVIIGVSGGRAHGLAEAYRHVRRGRLVAVSTRQRDNLDAFGDKFGVAARYTDYHEMFEKEQPDLVHLNTPPSVRLEIFEAAEKAGVPAVLVEKPLATTTAAARRIVDLLAVKEEMVDRFGRPPFQVTSLLNIMEIKIMARQGGLDAVQLEKSRFRMIFPQDLQVTPADIQRLVERSSTELEFNITDRLVIETFIRASDEQERLEKARNIVEEIL